MSGRVCCVYYFSVAVLCRRPIRCVSLQFISMHTNVLLAFDIFANTHTHGPIAAGTRRRMSVWRRNSNSIARATFARRARILHKIDKHTLVRRSQSQLIY